MGIVVHAYHSLKSPPEPRLDHAEPLDLCSASEMVRASDIFSVDCAKIRLSNDVAL